jgi:integrase
MEPTMTKITTASSVDALKPSDQRYIVRDSEVSGLELRVAPDGVKTWSLRYRNATKEQRRLKLGVFPRMTLAKAREAANKELRKVDGGIDPQAERTKAVREAARDKADSVEVLCDTYITEYAKPRKRSWRADQMRLKKDVLPYWRRRAVSSIERRDCIELVDRIAKRGAGIVANRTAALLSKMFDYAVRKLGTITSNPAARLPKLGVEAAQRPEDEREVKPYGPEEIRALWQATEPLLASPKAILRLGLLTGQRPTEISDMAWSEVDGAWWTLPPSRTKNRREHRVYLTPTAQALIRAVPRVEDELHVFVGYRGKRQMSAINMAVFAGVRRRRNPRHAMRDTVVTELAKLGVAVEDISKVVNHTYGPKVTAGYNAYHYDKERRQALTKWGRRLDQILADDKKQDEPKVVSIAG